MSFFSFLARLRRAVTLRLQAFALRSMVWIVRALDRSPQFPCSRKLSIASADNKRRIKLEIYEPDATADAGPKPVHVNFHGSGFVLMPMLGTNARFCSLLVRELGCIVVDGDYAKAPEHPFPDGFEDAMQVVSWVLANVDGQFDTERVSVGGFSAGANLALAVCGQLPAGTLKGVVSVYPPTDFTIKFRDKAPAPPGKPEAGGPLPIWLGEFFLDAYVGHVKNLRDPRFSVRWADISKYPGNGRTLLVTCEYDQLDKEAQAFKDQLVEAGKDPEYMWMDKLGHGWDGTCKEGTDAAARRDEVYMKAVEVLRKAYAKGV